MIPILFSEASTQFNTNGLGRLSDAISCTVKEERNGQYELEMYYPATGAHFDDIANRAIIVALPYRDADPQPFRIYQISRPIGGKVRINARHISYDLAKNTAMPFSVEASSTACYQTLQGLKTNAVETCPFTFETDVQTMAPYKQSIPSTIRQRLGGIEGSVLDQFGGEYEWDGYTVKLLRSRGSDNGVVLRYGKNITDLTQEEIISETITGVVPYWSNMDSTEVVTLPEKAVYSSHASSYSEHLTVPLDLSDDFDEAPTEIQLRTAAEVYITKHDIGVPTVSIKVSFVNLKDTIEYKDMESLQNVHLCDTLTVQFEKLGINTTAKVSAYEWDVLGEKYNEINVGTIKPSLASTINDQNAQTVASIDSTKIAAGKATAWLSSGDGYLVAVKGPTGEWKELLAMDTPDIETAEKIMMLNEQGLGGTTGGISGNFNVAIMIDGTIVADAVKTGILTDQEDKFYLNMETGELVMKDGTFSGLITGSVVRFGDDTGENYAEMKWSELIPGLSAYQLLINANGGRPIRILSKTGQESDWSNAGYMDVSAGIAQLVGTGSALIHGGSHIFALNDTDGITVDGWHAGKSTADDLVFGTFEQNGNKYFGVYTDNGDGTASPYGSVLLT